MTSENSFDVLRLVGALLVLYSHNYVLRGLPEPSVGGPTFGRIGVIMFFAISGYLNGVSILNNRSVGRFLLNRALRIYPALIVCVVAVACIASLFSTVGFFAYWGSAGPWRYMYLNSLMLVGELEWFLPGVFEKNPFRGGVNGSLWSIPYELVLYVGLALGMGVAQYSRIMIFAMLAVILATAATFELPRTITIIVPLQASEALLVAYVFFLGSAFAALRYLGLLLSSGFAALVALCVFPFQPVWGCLGLFSTGVVLLGHFSCRQLQPSRDISYGLYLYAFPIQQVCVLVVADFWLGLAISAATAMAAGMVSSIVVEEPFLRLKNSRTSVQDRRRSGAGARPRREVSCAE